MRHQRRNHSQSEIEKLKNKLANRNISFIEFYTAFYLKFSNDDYKTFLKKLNFNKVWTELFEKADKLLEKICA